MPDEGIEPPTFGLQNRCSTAELIRPRGRLLASSGLAPAQGLHRPAGTVGVHGPSTATASSMPGQGGMVIATKASGAVVLGAELERASRAGSSPRRRARAARSVSSAAGRRHSWPRPDDDVPDLLDRAMRRRRARSRRRAARNAPCCRRRGSSSRRTAVPSGAVASGAAPRRLVSKRRRQGIGSSRRGANAPARRLGAARAAPAKRGA